MSFQFSEVTAREILDSRGRPTLSVRLRTGAIRVSAAVPSGASTGAAEAVELRDGDPDRYSGAGVTRAVASVRGEIAELLCARHWSDLSELDAALVALDGTPNKHRLGANAIVGVSMAAARAVAALYETTLYGFLRPPGCPFRLPVPHFNLLNGGAHAANRVEFQEFMVAPVGAPSMAEAVRAGAEIYAALRTRLRDAGLATGLGDEGGFAPDLNTPEQACEHLVAAITAAGYEPSRSGVALALDPAASQFHVDDRYELGGQRLTSAELVDRYGEMIERFPIWSIEDGMAEDDYAGWANLTASLGERIQVVGDDLLVTDRKRIQDAAAKQWANAALIKLNQVGTVSETLDALRQCRELSWEAMISHRSGETPDDFIADLAVGSGCGQIKSGAPARGERIAKYNRLTEIAEDLRSAPYGLRPRTHAA
jgi:enolase